MDYYQKNSLSCIDEYTYGGWETLIRANNKEEDKTIELRKGPWTPEEDSKLKSSIAIYGEGRWDSLALLSGLRRSGKSCRLRWLNYLHPDLRRGTFTLEEQLLIIQLHFHWGNRWSKIAEHLPGRTDNEIKNYWRTKVQKLARQFQCHVNSPQFRDALRYMLIPRLVEQIQANSNASSNSAKAQNEGPVSKCGFGLNEGYYSSSSSTTNCCFDTTTSWAQTLPELEQLVVGPSDLCSKPSILTDSGEAQISSESSASTELAVNWEELNNILWDMTPNDEDHMLFFQQQLVN